MDPAPLRARCSCAPRSSPSACRAPRAGRRQPGDPDLQGRRHDRLRQDRLAEAVPAARVLGNRDFFFYEGMKLEIGPFYRDYTPSPPPSRPRPRSTRASAKIGPEREPRRLHRRAGRSRWTRSTARAIRRPAPRSSGTSTTSGRATARNSRYYYSYWDRGEELPLYYEGTAKTIKLSRPRRARVRDEPGGDLFRGEKRKNAFGIEVDAPFDARGILVMTYRYKESELASGADQERRHLGVRADAAPRAPHLLGAAHRRRVGHRLHVRRPAQLRRHRPAVQVGVPGRDGPSSRR